MKGTCDVRERTERKSRVVRIFSIIAAVAIAALGIAVLRQAYFLWIAE